MNTTSDIFRISEAMHNQYLALDEAGIDPSIEFVELELFFEQLSRQIVQQAGMSKFQCSRSGTTISANLAQPGRMAVA